MPLLPLILARNEDGDFFKVLFGVAVVAFWIIKAIASAVAQNKKTAPQRRAPAAALPRPGYGGAMNAPFPPRVPPPPAVPDPRSRQRSQKKRAKPPFATAPAAVARPVQSIPQAPRPEAAALQSPSRVAAKNAPANAARVGRLLRRPDTLRAALILNEVLAPPLALRDPPREG